METSSLSRGSFHIYHDLEAFKCSMCVDTSVSQANMDVDHTSEHSHPSEAIARLTAWTKSIHAWLAGDPLTDNHHCTPNCPHEALLAAQQAVTAKHAKWQTGSVLASLCRAVSELATLSCSLAAAVVGTGEHQAHGHLEDALAKSSTQELLKMTLFWVCHLTQYLEQVGFTVSLFLPPCWMLFQVGCIILS